MFADHELNLHDDPEEAHDIAECQAHRLYDELCSAVAGLLPWVGGEQTQEENEGVCRYNVVCFAGQKAISKGGSTLNTRLKMARKASKQGAARDALVAALAALSSRDEQTWLHTYSEEEPRGFFAHALIDASSRFRISYKLDGPSLRPASLLLTYLVPLQDALGRMDLGGPLERVPKKWGQKSSQELALQEIDPAGDRGVVLGTNGERQALSTVRPEPKIKELLNAETPVVMLEIYAALSPRDHARSHSLNQIIKAELVGLLRTAKAEGRAVVFHVCKDDPLDPQHTLAEKVYLRPAFTQFGLRCGYLRWRPSPSSPWVQERKKGLCIGLQMP